MLNIIVSSAALNLSGVQTNKDVWFQKMWPKNSQLLADGAVVDF